MGTTTLSTAFAALADDTRRDIVARLASRGDATVTELAADYEMSLQAVSKHVGVLGDAGLVSRRREGRRRPVSLEPLALSLPAGWLGRRRREAEDRHRRLDAVLDDLAARPDPPPSEHDPRPPEPDPATPTRQGPPMASETTVRADAGVPIIRIRRDFAAPPADVFRAHVDPALIVRWLGPDDLEMTVDVWDCRQGGEYRYVHRRPGEEHAFHGCFHAVVPDRRIVQTFTWEGHPDGVSLDTLELTALAGGTTRLEVASLVESFEARDAMLASGMERGIEQGYRSLDDVLAGGPGRGTTR